MRVLVTGISGFIGSTLAPSLAREHQVVGLDLRPAPSHLSGIPGLECVQADIRNRSDLDPIFARTKPEAVLHLAARTDLEGRHLQAYDANTVGVENLTRCIKEFGNNRLCVITSSQLVCRVGHVPKSELEFCPDTIYGQSKVATEEIARSELRDMPNWFIVRPTTVWGPGMSAHYQRFISLIERGRFFHVGASPLFKSYAYIDNIVAQYKALLSAFPSAGGRTLYLCDYSPLSLRRYCDGIAKLLDARPIPTIPAPLARLLAVFGDCLQHLGYRSFPFTSFRLRNILTEYQFDTSVTASICGPLPIDFETGVARTVDWYKGRKFEDLTG